MIRESDAALVPMAMLWPCPQASLPVLMCCESVHTKDELTRQGAGAEKLAVQQRRLLQ